MAHKMKHFTKMLKTLLTLFTEHFILVIWRGFEYHSIIVSQCKENTSEISRVFPTEGCGESPPPLHQPKLCSSPTRKNPPSLLVYHFCFNWILFGPTSHANFGFNWCSVFTESFFYLWEKVWLVKITTPQVLTAQ